MRLFSLPICLAVTVSMLAQTPSTGREPLSRASRSGGLLFTIGADNELIFRTLPDGQEQSRYRLPIQAPVLDFATTSTNDFFLLTSTRELIRWTPDTASFTFRSPLDPEAVRIAVDPTGSLVFAATAEGRILRVDGLSGAILDRSEQRFPAIQGLRYDDVSNTLQVESAAGPRSLTPELREAPSVKASALIAAAGAGRQVAEIYPSGFRIAPQLIAAAPGQNVTFEIRTVQRDVNGLSFALTVDSPIAGTLARNTMLVDDVVQYQIAIPANQPPGVYRMVARLDGGINGYASAVIVIPFSGSTVIPFSGTGLTQTGTPVFFGSDDPNFRIINPIDPSCATAKVAFNNYPVGVWATSPGSSLWISGRADAANGCLPGTYRFRTDISLTNLDPATANIAVAVWADNAATLEINGVAIPSEDQPIAEAELFRLPRVYAIPRQALRVGSNALDFLVRNDNLAGTTRNPLGLRVEVLYAAARPTQAPEPPPVGDYWLSLSPPFKFVNGTTAYYTVNVNRIGGFAGTPTLTINNAPPTGYTARFVGSMLEVTRDPNVTTAPLVWRFAVLGNFNQTTRSVDGAFIQNPHTPVDLNVYSTGVLAAATPAPSGSIDTHYSLVTSPDPTFPGPAARVADELTSPFGPWVLNDQYSRWISPRSNAWGSNAPGLYRYRTTFDMGLGSPDTAAIAIRWAADNDARVYLNGSVVAALLDPANFRRLNEALITTGFRPGLNTIDIEVNNLDAGGPSPQGLRVEIVGAQAARNPNRLVQVLRGQTASGPTLLTGGAFAHNAPTGVTVTANATNLLFTASNAAPLGVHPIRVTFTANNSTLDVLLVVGGRNSVLYTVSSTGQADEGTLDPNYRMIESPDRLFLPPNAYVILSNTSPVSSGVWAPNQINSRWISPRVDAWLPNAPGAYRYRTRFDLTGRNVSDAMLALEWAADNRGRIELNGVLQDVIDYPLGFRNMRLVSITSGFVAGMNNLDFVVTNDGPGVSPTGLHVNILGAWANSTGTAPGPDYVLTPDTGVLQMLPGQSVNLGVRITPNFTFTQPVEFSVVNAPAGFNFSFNPVLSTTTTSLTITSNLGVEPGFYFVTIRGRWGDLIRETQVRVEILAP